MRLITAFFTGFIGLYSLLSYGFDNFEITAQTTSCEGKVGFTAFYTSDLYKVQEGWCSDPNDSGKNLQQVLLRSTLNPGSFDVLWVTQAEAQSIMQQVKEGRAAKIKRTQQPDLRIDMRNQGAVDSKPPVQTSASRSADLNQAADSVGPTINILDPMIANTRSVSQVMTDSKTRERTIVGKVEAPAGLVSLTVNGTEVKPNTNGVFKANISLENNHTLVKVNAIDQQGKIQKVEFQFRQDTLNSLNKSAQAHNEIINEFGNYHALIIANTEYAHLNNLITPANDAKVLAQLLTEKFGFQVQTIDNAKRYDILTALNSLRGTLTENDNLLIYYAGHGAFDKANKRGHWLPTDAEPESTANWISTIAITDIVNSMNARHVLLVADSCYSGALTRSTPINLDAGMSEEARAQWLQTMAKTRSRHLLTSGGIKPVLDDGGNGHSIFASAFIKALQGTRGVIDGSQIFAQVKQQVQSRAQSLDVEQTPMYAKLQESEHEFGEFLLVSRDD